MNETSFKLPRIAGTKKPAETILYKTSTLRMQTITLLLTAVE
jgi:hypothetical protein